MQPTPLPHAPSQRQLDGLDQALTQLLHELQAYSNDRLNQKPGAGQWSVMQVLHHLLLAESQSLRYLEKKLLDTSGLPRAGWRAWGRAVFVQMYLLSPLKVKAPAMVSDEHLPDFATLEATTQSWYEVRLRMRQLLAQQPPQLFGLEVYRHPLVGRLTLPGMLGFLAGHFNRHRKQIHRVLQQTSAR